MFCYPQGTQITRFLVDLFVDPSWALNFMETNILSGFTEQIVWSALQLLMNYDAVGAGIQG